VTPIADVGDELPYAPKQTYVASLSWRVPVSERLGEIDAGATYSSIGKQRSAATSSGPYGMLDSFELLNLNLTWSRIFRSPMDLVVFGTNVLDEEYVTYTSGTYNLLGFESRSVGLPRTVGARLRYNFGAER
jgi:iron complex outermembrane recepter protein